MASISMSRLCVVRISQHGSHEVKLTPGAGKNSSLHSVQTTGLVAEDGPELS